MWKVRHTPDSITTVQGFKGSRVQGWSNHAGACVWLYLINSYWYMRGMIIDLRLKFIYGPDDVRYIHRIESNDFENADALWDYLTRSVVALTHPKALSIVGMRLVNVDEELIYSVSDIFGDIFGAGLRGNRDTLYRFITSLDGEEDDILEITSMMASVVATNAHDRNRIDVG